jgi:hypothetical protein
MNAAFLGSSPLSDFHQLVGSACVALSVGVYFDGLYFFVLGCLVVRGGGDTGAPLRSLPTRSLYH